MPDACAMSPSSDDALRHPHLIGRYAREPDLKDGLNLVNLGGHTECHDRAVIGPIQSAVRARTQPGRGEQRMTGLSSCPGVPDSRRHEPWNLLPAGVERIGDAVGHDDDEITVR